MNKDILVSITTIIDDTHNSSQITQFIRDITHVVTMYYQHYEIILIGNGISIRFSMELQKCINMPRVRLVHLANHYDEDIAYTVALETAIGDTVILMDYRYDPCLLVPQMIDKIYQEKVDVVIAVNNDKKSESFLYDLLAQCFYKLARYMYAQSVDFDRTHFSCYSRTAINSITQYKNHIRNLRLLRTALGVETSIIYYQKANKPGKHQSPNVLNRLFSRLEEVSSLSAKPLRIVSAICFFSGVANIFYSAYVMIIKLFAKNVMSGWASLSIAQSCMFAVFFFTLGIVSHYLNIIFREVQQRPLYVILNEWSSTTPLELFLQKNVVE